MEKSKSLSGRFKRHLFSILLLALLPLPAVIFSETLDHRAKDRTEDRTEDRAETASLKSEAISGEADAESQFSRTPILKEGNLSKQEGLLAQAEDLDDSEDFEIGEELDSSDDGGDEVYDEAYLERTVSGKIGFSYAPSFLGPDYRFFSYLGLGWRDRFDWVSFNVEMLAFRRDFRYALQLSSIETDQLADDITVAEAKRDEVGANTPLGMQYQMEVDELISLQNMRSADPEFSLTLLDNELLFREAYTKVDITDNVQFLLGVHTVVWGQLDFVSPIDFILPLRVGSTGLGLTKVDSRNPQTSAILYIFPTNKIELQLYYFPFLDLDEAFRENLFEDVNQNTEYTRFNELKFPSGAAEARYAGRLLFYLNRLTIGFTYYHGWFQFGPRLNASLRPDPINTDIYYLEGAPLLQRVDFYAIELATPIGEWILKFETSYFSLPSDYDIDIDTYNNQTLGYLPLDNPEDLDQYEARQRYIDWIILENGGKLEVDENIFFSALGVDANLDRWLLNLGLLFFVFDRDESAQRGLNLYVEAEQVEDDGPLGGSDFGAAPTLNIAYYLDSNKEDALGFAAGFLNGGFGAILYFTQEYYESLRLAIGLEYLALFSNGLVNVEGYEIKDEGFPAIRWVAEYRF